MNVAPAVLPLGLRLAARRAGVRWTRHLLLVWTGSQRLDWLEYHPAPAPSLRSAFRSWPGSVRWSPGAGFASGISTAAKGCGIAQAPATGGVGCGAACRLVWRQRLVVSTSRYGTGQVQNSHRTPLGLHRIARKVGGGWPVGTVFQARQPIGLVWNGLPEAPIAHRILWLEGLEPGFNRGGVVDSFQRFIYLHGVGQESGLGRPASIGCIHLSASDLIPLFEVLPTGTLVWVSPCPAPGWPVGG